MTLDHPTFAKGAENTIEIYVLFTVLTVSLVMSYTSPIRMSVFTKDETRSEQNQPFANDSKDLPCASVTYSIIFIR